MPRTVQFSDDEIKAAQEIAPLYPFSEFAHMALKEEIQRRKEKRANEAA